MTPLRRRSVGLGYFSLGLGLTQVLAARQTAKWLGLDGHRASRLRLMAIGARELACGVGLLSQTRPVAWAWLRTAGDLMDLALVGSAVQSGRMSPRRGLGVAAGILGVAVIDAKMAVNLQRNQEPEGISVTQSITIARRPGDVYAFFRDFQNLPTFMSHLDSVRVDGATSRWRARGPLGTRIEWDAEIIQDRPGELIAWRSVAHADVPNHGRVRFRPIRGIADGEPDTELIVELSYDPPAGALGAAVAKLFGKEPGQQVSADLRRLKQMLETGEVLHSDASIHRGMHPARPSSQDWNQESYK